MKFVSESEEVVAQTPSYVRDRRRTPVNFFAFLLLVCSLHGLIVVVYGLSGENFSRPLDPVTVVELVSSQAQSDPGVDASEADTSLGKADTSLSRAMQSKALNFAPDSEPVAETRADVAVQKASGQHRPQKTAVKSVNEPTERLTADNSATSSRDNTLSQSESTQAAVHGSDRGPQPLNNTKPPYPRSAVRARQEGMVFLNIDIGADGTVNRAELASISGFELLDQSALDTAVKWVFSPAVKGGKPVAERVRIGVKFDLKNL